MNLYIISNVLSDYTPGLVVIAAESKENAREFFVEKFTFGQRYGDEYVNEYVNEFDNSATFKVIEDVNHPAGVVDYVYGGG